MSDWKPKRFWTHTEIVEVKDGYTVVLDGRSVKTPAKAELLVPTRRFAEEIAREWDAQTEVVDPNIMPMTRLANAAIDKVAVQFDEVALMIAEYGSSDLLCYRAEEPPELVKRQAASWDPILSWATETLNAPLTVVQGVMFQTQPENSIKCLTREVMRLTEFELAAFHDLVSISGSLLLGFAVIRDHISAEDAWKLSRVDEEWQIEQWGHDEEATELVDKKREQFIRASVIFGHLKREVL